MKKFMASALLAVLTTIGFGAFATAQEDQLKTVLAVGDIIDLDGTKATIIEVDTSPDFLPYYYRAEVKNVDGSPLAELTLVTHNNLWTIAWRTRIPSETSCSVEERWMRSFARQAGFSPQGFEVSNCKIKPWAGSEPGTYFLTEGRMPLKWVGVKPKNAQCAADAYVGTWQRPGGGKQSAQVQLVFSKDGDEGDAKARGFNRSPYGDGEQILSRIRSSQGSCRFTAKCGSVLSSSPSCTVVIDPAKNTLTVEGGATVFVSELTWTRATPAPAQAKCSREDIEGDWIRSDGALVPIVGVDAGFRDGGTALLFNHPEGWPKGQSKYRNIKRDGGPQSCKMTAICADYDRNPSTGSFTRNERACTLTVDPVKRTLTQGGSSLTYTRKGNAAPASRPVQPAAPPVSIPVTSEQEQRELAERERLNREQIEFSKRQLAENEASRRAFEQAVKDREATIARQKAEHEAAVAAVEAERLRREREHEAAMAKWRADVEACKNGDKSRCGQ